MLVRNSGHVVEKDELLKAVWPDTFVEEGVLAVNVAAIRKALSDGEEGRSYIETVPRRGYRFIGEVQALEKVARGCSYGAEVRQRRKKSLASAMGTAAGLLALVLAGLGWFHFPVAANFNSATFLAHPAHQLSRHRTQSELLARRQPGGLQLEWRAPGQL